MTLVCTAKNEAQNLGLLLEDLLEQNFKNFDLYLFDNQSTDNTKEIAAAYLSQLPMKVLTVETEKEISAKKQAITQAVQLSDSDFFVCVDADCRMGKDWLSSLSEFSEFDFVASSVCIDDEKSFIEIFQSLEFCTLMLVTGAFFNIGSPIMSNGANMAFSRRAFRDSDPYAHNLHIATGDDEFLLYAVKQRFPRTLSFNFDPKAIVSTRAQTTLRGLLHQKIRWASKWKYNKSPLKYGFAALIFMANAGFVFMLVSGQWVWLLVKFLTDCFVLSFALVFFGKMKLWKYVPFCVLVYPFYAFRVGISSLLGFYEWKGKVHRF